MTEYTVVRELFCCGSGKGGVMQNQGKENEYLPRLMPMVEGGNEHLDCVVGLWACMLPCAESASMLTCVSLRVHFAYAPCLAQGGAHGNMQAQRYAWQRAIALCAFLRLEANGQSD